ncbi:hypothetical protein D7X55_36605 [Corallococcus sp. AB049A]|uniref:Uncharacterized protein n=1 Tax=Corallococcus interemptor TaxID=2316720 RepID=A0A3A8Q410_9BACT|nr:MULTISPECIES: hypothetical protein [Corallococcus]RKH38079.1 hypothetical protein D7Y23_38630 [Corallococcus sp. AB050B]RKH60805.1 hypothetical protein D7X96_32845 [Corallococcus interemptor]RKI47622.1 hypothetical protein D7X55_36605 [Corallococcus sp. AB049A]
MGSNTINRTSSFSPTARTTGPTQSNPAASNQAMRELNTFSAQLKQAAAAPAQQQAPAQKRSAEETQQLGQQVVTDMSKKYLGFLAGIGKDAGNRTINATQAKVDAFIAANPDATQAQIEDVAKKEFNKSSSAEYIFKSVIEKSMSDVMAKVQERIDENK